jgi:hypothetical protein
MKSVSAFPFRKLIHNKYLTLDVLMYVDYYHAQEFMFGVNKETRTFVQDNFITVRNEFVNEGLVVCEFDAYYQSQFNNYD